MSFSKEDRKKVFDFFENLLRKFDKPVYYDLLRGYVSQAEPVVRKYVFKECKGEKLLHYFQTRKNYFFVDFRNEVMLLHKSKCVNDTHPEADKLDAGQHATAPDNISNEELTGSDYFNSSRSTSVSSRYGSEASSVDDAFVDAINKKSECEKETLKYFSDYLSINKKLNLQVMEIKCLPKNIRHYVTKYLKKDIAMFFKNNPETFCIDDKNYVSLVPSQKPHHDTTVKTEEEITLQDDDFISLHNFIHCAEFFFGILKKNFLPLSYLSGHLSRASPDVSEYLLSNYVTFKDFLLDADKLFVFNDYEEVAVTKEGPKLLKSANKLLHGFSTISSESLKRQIYCYLKSETSKKRNSLEDKDQEKNCSDVKQLDISNMKDLNEDSLHLDDSKKVKPKKLNISDEENINIESKDCSKKKSDNLHVANKKKLKADKLNITNDENINVSSVDCNKTLEDKFKNEPIITNIYEENVIEVVDEELALDVGGKFETFMDFDESDKIQSNTQRNFIECVFTIQLLCLEMVEKQLILCYKYEYDAVKHFVEVLEKLPSEMNDVTSLKGCLGQASKEVNFFMKTLYKGDKISLFFEKHAEFDLDGSKILRLSPTYKCDLEDKRKVHKFYVAGTKVYDVYKLYNPQLLDMVIDVLDCLTKICCFFQNKPRIKLTRLNGVTSKFSPSQQIFINSLTGGVIHEKLERFLCYFSFFHSTKGYIEFNPEHFDITLFLNSMIKFTQKLNMLSTYEESKLVYFDYLLDYLKVYESDYSVMSCDEMKIHVIEGVQNFLLCSPDLEYSDLPNVVGYEILHSLVLEKKDSQVLIQLLEDSNLFLLNDGKISHRQENDKVIDFLSDSNLSDKISFEDSRNEKSQSSVTENENKLQGKKEHISNDGQKNALLNRLPSFLQNDERVDVKVDEVLHEDLQISLPKRSSFIEDDICIDSEESETVNKKLMNEDSRVVSFNKNKFSDQQQDEQNDLNHEYKFRNKLISSASAQNDARRTREINIQDECNHSDMPSNEKAVLNVELGKNISCATIFNEQEVESVSRSHCVDDKAAEVVKSSISESNKEIVSEDTDSIIKQENSTNTDEIGVLAANFSKPPLLSNSKVDYSTVWESLCKSSTSSVKENNASEICDKQISSNTNDVTLNCIENISSTENVESVSFISTSAMNSKDKQMQNASHCDHKSDSDHEKYIRNASLAEHPSPNTSDNVKSHPTLNFESNHNNNKTDLNKTSKTGNESVTSPTFSGSAVSKSDSNESDSESDKPQHNFDSTYLQPLQAKIIVLTLDSCIAETVVNGQKKCIFCLKSCFHCDLHSDCSDCFNSLVVGDEILCYIPPTEDFSCGNMCFAFMFHKDLGIKEKSKRSLDTEDHKKSDSSQIIEAKYSSSKNDGATSHRDNIHSQYLQSNSDKCYTSMVEERQVQCSVISQSTEIPSPILSQSTQVQSSLVSQTTQTIESSFKKCYKIEKECQVNCVSISRITQTVNVTSEADCQTVLAGEVKSCVSVCEKSCLTRFPTFSQKTQTSCETLEQGSQTNLSGNIIPKCDTSSCECQTILTGQVKKCESSTDKWCQTLFSKQVDKTTQIETENAAEMTAQNGTNLESGSFGNIPCDANTGARSKHSFLVAQKEFCDTSCQTRSTGAIYLMAIYHDEE